MTESSSFGEWLRLRRRSCGYTQQELAARAFCSTSAIRKFEQGERHPSRTIAESLASALLLAPEEREFFLEWARTPAEYTPLPMPLPQTIVAPFALPAATPAAIPVAIPAATSALDAMPALLEPASFSAPAHSAMQPIALTPLIGRQQEVAQIADLLANSACRLLTLLGSGGIGKTRLALVIAEDARARQPVYFVDFASTLLPDDVLTTIASAVNVQRGNPADLHPRVAQRLHEEGALVIMDNMEHLLDAASVLITLLQDAPASKFIVTSRERLNVQNEWVLEVHGLPLKPPEAQNGSAHARAAEAEQPQYSTAASLFVQVARRANPGFAPTPEDVQAIDEVCALVDGNPLAIELAAAWVRLLSCREIVLEIGRGLDFLTTTARNVPPRHRSMRAVVQHSWSLLTPAEQKALRQFSVFRGGFDRDAAAAVVGASLRMLASLVDKSLIHAVAASRYDLHEIVRLYAEEQLQETGETLHARDLHARYFAGRAMEYSAPTAAPNSTVVLSWNKLEQANCIAALRHALATSNRPVAMEVCMGMTNFWLRWGDLRAGHEWFQKSLALPGIVDIRIEALALRRAAVLAHMRGDYDQARKLELHSLAMYEEMEDDAGRAILLNNLARVEMDVGNFAAAQTHLEACIALATGTSFEDIVANAYCNLGLIAWFAQDAETSLRHYETASTYYKKYRDVLDEISLQTMLGEIYIGQGRLDEAEELLLDALRTRRQVGDRTGVIGSFATLAELAYARGNMVDAVLLLGAADGLRRQFDWPRAPVDNMPIDSNLHVLQERLGAENYARIYARGERLPMTDIIAWALKEKPLQGSTS